MRCALYVDLVGDVRFGSKADISQCNRHVRFTPKSGQSSAHRIIAQFVDLNFRTRGGSRITASKKRRKGRSCLLRHPGSGPWPLVCSLHSDRLWQLC